MWSDPVVEAVTSGVHRLPVPMPDDGLKAVNVYAVETGGTLALIDTGWGTEDAWTALNTMLAACGFAVADIGCVLVTHAHEDHMGLAARIQRESGARVVAGSGERISIDAIRNDWDGYVESRMAFLASIGAGSEAAEQHDRMRRERPDWDASIDYVDPREGQIDGLTLRGLATPGHTRGHLCFVEDERKLLFTGDHVLPHITPAVGFQACPSPIALRDYLQSLELVRELEQTLVLPAHGERLAGSAERAAELLAHHNRRLDLTAAAVNGLRSAHEVAAALPWTRHARSFADLESFHRMLAVWETWQHLEYLADTGRLVAERDAPVVRFRS